MDMAAILRELSQLRNEVCCISVLKEEVINLRKAVNNLKANQCITEQSMSVPADEPEQSSSRPRQFVEHARQLQHTSIARKKQTRLVVGTSQMHTKLKSVPTVKSVDIFVSRLHPCTTESEIVECTKEVKGDLNLVDVVCTRLKSRYEDLYCSMHVAIKVDAAEFKSAVTTYMSAESWPAGVFVKRFFVNTKRDGNGS